jgi:branched-chain amino acid transport system ATP-binding protein
MNTQPLFEVKHLNTRYGKAQILEDLNFNLPKEQVVTIVGPNGGGKSTLLNSLMGLIPCSAQLLFNGEDISTLPLEERVMLGLSLVPEKRELFSSMSVQDNIELGSYRQTLLTPKAVKSNFERVYELFPRLKERRHQISATLSGGERQMLAIARALMADPKLLMLDEPSLGLAPLIVKEIFEIMAHLKTDGVTLLLVEQNARAALSLADYGHVLEMGHFVISGQASTLASDPRVIETYLGFGKNHS